MEKKLYKVICRESEFSTEGEILIGYFTNTEADYFRGVSFYWWKEEWAGGDFVNFSKADYEKVAESCKEIEL